MDEDGDFGTQKQEKWENFSKWMYQNQITDNLVDYSTSFTDEYAK